MSVPVITFGDYVFCFDAESEEESSESHFIDFCGWTSQEFAQIKNYPFFCARVSCWKDGEELSTDYLGACCYKTESAFYKTYMGDYFADMVRTCAHHMWRIRLTIYPAGAFHIQRGATIGYTILARSIGHLKML